MPDETPNQIENNTSAQVQGYIKGIVNGVAYAFNMVWTNWHKITAAAAAIFALYTFYQEKVDNKTSEKQRGLLWHETHRVDQAVGISVTETNK